MWSAECRNSHSAFAIPHSAFVILAAMTDSASPQTPQRSNWFSYLVESSGLQPYGGHSILLVVIVGMIWIGRANLLSLVPTSMDVSQLAQMAETLPTPTPVVALVAGTQLPVVAQNEIVSGAGDLTRQTDIHTNIPTRPRQEIVSYTVQSGDTLFGIAEKFGLKPETIVWGNPVLKDDPHLLRPGQELRIPPVDGVLRDVQVGDRLDVLARYYQVTVDDIVNWPGNDLD